MTAKQVKVTSSLLLVGFIPASIAGMPLLAGGLFMVGFLGFIVGRFME
jgi:hypothetical protein